MSVENFDKEISAMLNGYEEHLNASIRNVIDEVAEDAVNELHSAYPNGTGEYNAGWTSTANTRGDRYYRVIHGGKPTYRLAHLLEKGHLARNGKRVNGFVHIKPISKEAANKLKERLASEISKFQG